MYVLKQAFLFKSSMMNRFVEQICALTYSGYVTMPKHIVREFLLAAQPFSKQMSETLTWTHKHFYNRSKSNTRNTNTRNAKNRSKNNINNSHMLWQLEYIMPDVCSHEFILLMMATQRFNNNAFTYMILCPEHMCNCISETVAHESSLY